MKNKTHRCAGSLLLWVILVGGLFPAGEVMAANGRIAPESATPAAKSEYQNPAVSNQVSAETLASEWGIQISALRVSAGGNIVDFRYRVLDPQKAARLADPEVSPVLIDQETGVQLHIPSTKAGQLRGTSKQLIAGKIYIMLFANPTKAVKPGHSVTLVVADSKHADLVVGK